MHHVFDLMSWVWLVGPLAGFALACRQHCYVKSGIHKTIWSGDACHSVPLIFPHANYKSGMGEHVAL